MVTQAGIYHFHLNFLHTFTALGNSNPWAISWTSTYLEVIFVSLLVISIQFYPTSRKNIVKCSAVRNIDFVSKQQCQFFVFTFFVTFVQIQCPSPYFNQASLLNSFSKISIHLLLPLKWVVHFFRAFLPHPICLFPYFRLFALNSQ